MDNGLQKIKVNGGFIFYYILLICMEWYKTPILFGLSFDRLIFYKKKGFFKNL